MAPTKFQIYVDQSIRQQASEAQTIPPPQPKPVLQPVSGSIDGVAPRRYIPEVLKPDQRFYFDERKIYPAEGGEFSFEELNLVVWSKKQQELRERLYREQLERENQELKAKLESLIEQFQSTQQQQYSRNQQQPNQQLSPLRRISVVPQSLQPTQGLEYTEMSVYGGVDNAPTVVNELWLNTARLDKIQSQNPFANDKITLPIDQSQYIRENIPTSTPTSKSHHDNDQKKAIGMRRLSRPSMGGSPTLKLSPITETSRDCNSKSSSSSSAISGTPGTAKKVLHPLLSEPQVGSQEPDKPLDPNDPTTYRKLLTSLAEPLDRRPGFHRHNRSLPKIRHGACVQAGADNYLVDKELSKESKIFTAQLLTDESNDDDSSSMEIPIKTFCIRVDQPANEWLYYVCNELHRRLVRQTTKPDIELSVMIANPAIFYNDGSILIDEYFRFFTMQQFLEACKETSKPFPKSVAAYVSLELIQIVKQVHSCGIIHMNVNPTNIVFTCCPNRDDVASVDERTSIVKLIGFERAMDTRLLPENYKFDCKLEDLNTCQMRDGKPWTFEVDWFGVLDCIHWMFFNEAMAVEKNGDRWAVSRKFAGCPTGVWSTLFEKLLNISDSTPSIEAVDIAIDELTAWVKANLSFVLKEAAYLDGILEEHCRNNNKSMRT